MANERPPDGARTQTGFDEAAARLGDVIKEMEEHVQRVLRSLFEERADVGLPIVNGVSVQKALDGGLRFDLLGDMAESVGGHDTGWRRPFLDLSLDGDTERLVLQVELPGVRKDQVGLEVLPEGIYLKAEGARRRYQASVRPGVLIDPEGAKASLEDGILTATFPVARVEARRRRVPLRGKSEVRRDAGARRVPVE